MEDIIKEIPKNYKDNTDSQATLRDDIESVSDNFFSVSESLYIFKDLMTNKFKLIQGSIQN